MAVTLNPSFTTSIRGVAKTFSGGSIEDYTITDSSIFETVQDQNGAVACEMVYDHKKELTMTMHAAGSTAPTMPGDTFTFDSLTWQTDSCAEAGSFQNVRRWTINAHRYDNSPASGGGNA
jgi:hypothetical protein